VRFLPSEFLKGRNNVNEFNLQLLSPISSKDTTTWNLIMMGAPRYSGDYPRHLINPGAKLGYIEDDLPTNIVYMYSSNMLSLRPESDSKYTIDFKQTHFQKAKVRD